MLALLLTIFWIAPARAQGPVCAAVADFGGEGSAVIDGEQEDEDLLTLVDILDPNPETNETPIGNGTGTYRVEAIAFQPGTDVLYAADAGQMGRISLESGRFTPRPEPIGAGPGKNGLPDVTFDDVDGLTFDPANGTLWGSQRRSGADLLLRIDPSSGAHVGDAFGPGGAYVPIEPLGDLDDIDDIAIDPTDGQMYAIANDGGRDDRLMKVDRITGGSTDVGSLGVEEMEGLAFTAAGDLLATSSRAPDVTESALWDIDKQTGAASNPRVLDNGSEKEAISCPMPRVTPPPAPPPPPPPPPAEVGSITIVKEAVPDAAVGFGFAGDLGDFVLDGSDEGGTRSRTFSDLAAGRYEVVEPAADGWELTRIACADPDDETDVNVSEATATIDLDEGEDVICTFTNERVVVLGGPVPLPPTGIPGLGILSLIGGGMVAAGYGMRSIPERQRNTDASSSLRRGLLGAAAAFRVTGMPSPPSRVGQRSNPLVRSASAGGGAARVAAPERGPPRSRAP